MGMMRMVEELAEGPKLARNSELICRPQFSTQPGTWGVGLAVHLGLSSQKVAGQQVKGDWRNSRKYYG
jgi:hypothetical protein